LFKANSWQTPIPVHGVGLQDCPPASRSDPTGANEGAESELPGPPGHPQRDRHTRAPPLSCACSPERLGASQTCCRLLCACTHLRARSPLRSKARRSRGESDGSAKGRGPPPSSTVPATEPYICTRPGHIGRQRSRSLSELTRQITPRTSSGHAPPPGKSRKLHQTVHPHALRTW